MLRNRWRDARIRDGGLPISGQGETYSDLRVREKYAPMVAGAKYVVNPSWREGFSSG
jgi:hypothetical protein